MIEWKLERFPVRSLKEHPKNPRQISKAQFQHLSELIETFGLIDKPIINLDLTIIGGHQRIRILKKMKQKEVECWIPDHLLTDKEIDRLCIGLNQGGSWDWEIMGNLWEPLDLLKWGFTEEQLLGVFEEKKEKKKKNSSSKQINCPNCGYSFNA